MRMEVLKTFLARRGAVSELARAVGVTHGAISQWVSSRVPADRVVAVERATGIPREALRPDLYQRTGELDRASVD